MLAKKDNRPYTILIIEDNHGDFILIEDYILEHISFPHIVHATSLHEAKKYMGVECSIKFDLVMLDLTLPDGDGTSLISQIVEICPDWPIVVLTGYTDFEFSVRSLALGVSDYLLKDELTPSSLYKSIIYNIERKKARTELEESQKRYSNLFHLSPDPTWVCDAETHKFIDVNDAAIRNYGFTLSEFLEMHLEELVKEDDVQLPVLEKVMTPEVKVKMPLEQIIRHKKKSGEVIFVEKQMSEIFFQGRLAHIIVARDITDRIQYIAAIEEQNQRFSEIAWIQSHVVRAPIARLMGLVDLIRHPASDEKLRAELLDYIFESAKELDGIVREITLKTEEIDLSFDAHSERVD